ncbi:CopZ family metallochaperone [Gracilinema caldarium]|uniref:Heavy metal transport/detoxification protein n=1 Tax=Gracilinema caldarium (strain ATCC 51460 / DSM 7334 / H1) TaxID=744872 RepID=F8F4H6_GRAC1|nr:heavy-metal-associated domain-containing protein [Gracilinema caldarium]AEJ20623.1 Heavy metal transport/detoxification protein [Gracilinema caldarium DSM 7334]
MTKTLEIEGMTCKHCVMHVTNALKAVAGVTTVQVDLAGNKAVVEGSNLDDQALKDAVADAGYEVVAIHE